LGDVGARHAMGAAGRRRAVEHFSYNLLAARLAPVANGRIDALGPLFP
jgi:hypothetical protein